MHFISECLLIKDENRYLGEHITANRKAGISHFYIYDNMSVTPVKDYLAGNHPDLLKYCTIENIESGARLQEECYAQFVGDHGNETEWCSFTDTDEIYYGNLKKLCKECADFAAIKFWEITHGCNGHVRDTEGSLHERFFGHVVPRVEYVKMIARPSKILKQHPHKTELTEGKQYLVFNPKSEVTLHHYMYRSFEEWIQKYKRGSSMPHVCFRINGFFCHGNAELTPEHEALMARYGVSADYVMPYIKSRKLS